MLRIDRPKARDRELVKLNANRRKFGSVANDQTRFLPSAGIATSTTVARVRRRLISCFVGLLVNCAAWDENGGVYAVPTAAMAYMYSSKGLEKTTNIEETATSLAMERGGAVVELVSFIAAIDPRGGRGGRVDVLFSKRKNATSYNTVASPAATEGGGKGANMNHGIDENSTTHKLSSCA